MDAGDTLFFMTKICIPSAQIPYFCSVSVVAVGHLIPCGCVMSKTNQMMISKNAENEFNQFLEAWTHLKLKYTDL